MHGGDRVERGLPTGLGARATVTPGYFRALGLPLLQGRAFTYRDGPSAASVVIVNEALAHSLGLKEPVGKRLRIRDGWGWRSVEIVGLVADVLQFGYDPISLRDDVRSPATLYLPHAQPAHLYGAFQVDFHMPVNFVVRHRGDAAAIADAMKEIFRAVDRDTPIAFSGGLSDYVEEGMVQRRFLLLLMGLLASLSLALAAVGIYGVVAFQVGRRRHEIGVRMAVGAKARGIVGMIVGEGARIALLGALVGVGVAMVSTRLLSRWLYQVSPTEPVVFVSLALLSVATGALACLVPARRAARIDPVECLKAE